jgi:uncharacterized membrane protein YqgA involved in biofilm formation
MHADVVHAVCTVYIDYFTSFALACSMTAGVVLFYCVCCWLVCLGLYALVCLVSSCSTRPVVLLMPYNC